MEHLDKEMLIKECGANLSGLSQHIVSRHQVIDIVLPPAIVCEIVRYGRYYTACESYQRAAMPQGFEQGRVLGENIEQLVCCICTMPTR